MQFNIQNKRLSDDYKQANSVPGHNALL